jgi:hypothetical protein
MTSKWETLVSKAMTTEPEQKLFNIMVKSSDGEFEFFVKRGTVINTLDNTTEWKENWSLSGFFTIFSSDGFVQFLETGNIDCIARSKRIDIDDPDYMIPEPERDIAYRAHLHELRLRNLNVQPPLNLIMDEQPAANPTETVIEKTLNIKVGNQTTTHSFHPKLTIAAFKTWLEGKFCFPKEKQVIVDCLGRDVSSSTRKQLKTVFANNETIRVSMHRFSVGVRLDDELASASSAPDVEQFNISDEVEPSSAMEAYILETEEFIRMELEKVQEMKEQLLVERVWLQSAFEGIQKKELEYIIDWSASGIPFPYSGIRMSSFVQAHWLDQTIIPCGRVVIKTHLKKKDAVASLAARGHEYAHKQLFPEDTNAAITSPHPVALEPLLAPLKQELKQMEEEMTKGTDNIIMQILHKLSDEQLSTLAEVMDGSDKYQYSEDKIVRILPIIAPQMNILDNAVQHIESVKLQTTKLFLTVYAQEYNKFNQQKGTARWDNEKFAKDVQSVINFRKGAQSSASTSNCVVM